MVRSRPFIGSYLHSRPTHDQLGKFSSLSIFQLTLKKKSIPLHNRLQNRFDFNIRRVIKIKWLIIDLLWSDMIKWHEPLQSRKTSHESSFRETPLSSLWNCLLPTTALFSAPDTSTVDPCPHVASSFSSCHDEVTLIEAASSPPLSLVIMWLIGTFLFILLESNTVNLYLSVFLPCVWDRVDFRQIL